jgi:hypothetical protein
MKNVAIHTEICTYKEKILHYIFVHIFDPNDFETVIRSDGKYPTREAFMTLAQYNKKVQ